MATYDRHDGSTGTGPGFGATNDAVRVSGGSTINSGIATGAGTDTVDIGASTVNGGVLTGDGADTVTVDSTYNVPASAVPNGPVTLNANAAGNGLALGAANDSLNVLNEVQVNGAITAGTGDDNVYIKITNQLYPGTTTGSITGVIDGGAGNDAIMIDSADAVGGVLGGVGNDTISLNSVTTYSGIIHGGDPTTPGQDGADIINLNAGTFQGGVEGGVANDTINIAYGTVFTGATTITGGANDDTISLQGGQFGSSILTGGTGSDAIVVSVLEGNLTIDGGEDGADDGTADGDLDRLDLSGLIGTVVYTSDPQAGESGIFTETATGRTITFTNFENFVPPLCFTAGTLIETSEGPRPVETLRPGDLVETRDNGLRPIRWISRRRIGLQELSHFPQLRPVLVPAGALGPGTPDRDLILSPQHRVLVRSNIARKMFDQPEVLIAVTHLVGIAGIVELGSCTEIEYLHILCDQHEIILANGADTETLFLGPEALKSLTDEGRDEIALIFPEVLEPGFVAAPPARPIPAGHQGKRLGLRHQKNGLAFYTPPIQTGRSTSAGDRHFR